MKKEEILGKKAETRETLKFKGKVYEKGGKWEILVDDDQQFVPIHADSVDETLYRDMVEFELDAQGRAINLKRV